MSKFTEEQRRVLLRPIDGWRVMELDGQSHLAAWDVIAHLNRVFGYEGWDKEILSLELVYEHVGVREIGHARNCNRRGDCDCRNAKTVPAVSVGYRCTLRLTVRNPEGQVVRVVEDAAMGTATNQRDMGDAHDLAVKSAVSYALKRCAKDLGDQFGLSLYNKGQESAVVMHVFPYDGDGAEITGQVHADGIEEGDDGFGSDRGEGEVQVPQHEEAHEPVEEGDPGGTHPVEEPEVEAAITEATRPEPVREPEPAKASKPEATPPPEKPEPTPVNPDLLNNWVAEISFATEINGPDQPESGPRAVRAIWKEIQNAGALDTPVETDDGKTTPRELMVAKVREIEEAA